MSQPQDTHTRDLFPLHKQREAMRLKAQAEDRRERAAFFARLGYLASANRLEEQAVSLELRALRLHA